MKRKLFLLLAAFMALVTFQANAAIPTDFDGTSYTYLLNVRGAKAQANDMYWNSTLPDTVGALTLPGTDFAFKPEAGAFMNVKDYFKITQEADNVKRFSFKSFDGTKTLTYGGVTNWELVRFAQPINPSAANVTGTYNPKEGGYVCAPSAVAANDDGRQLLVRSIADNSLKLMSFKDYKSASNNYGVATQIWRAIWVEATPVSGRWARDYDFKDFPDFVKIVDGTHGNLKVDGYEKFHVVKSDEYNYLAANGGPEFTTTGLTAAQVTAGFGTRSKVPGEVLNEEGNIEIFALIAPETNGKLVTMKQGANVFPMQSTANNTVNGNKLTLADPKATIQDGEVQRFAIWINADGTFELYPVGAFTQGFGSTTPSVEKQNQAVMYNSPKIPVDYNVGALRADDFFKIGWAYTALATGESAQWVAGPTDYAASTAYQKALFSLLDITAYNAFAQKRYFYLETNIKGRNNVPMVLDVARQYATDGSVQKKLVLTDKEANRWRGENLYYNTPFDSLNLSAYWAAIAVYDREFDATITVANQKLIGYRLVNELSDTLYYSSTLGLSLAHEGLAYLKKEAGAVGTPGSDVWQAIHFEDALDKFFLNNLKDAGLFDVNSKTKANKYIKGWNAAIDLARQYNTTPNPVTGLVETNGYNGDPAIAQAPNGIKTNCFHYSSDNVGEQRKTYMWPEIDKCHTVAPYHTQGIQFAEETNIGSYEKVNSPWDVVKNAYGLELKLIPIKFNTQDPGPYDAHNVYWRHDSLDAQGKQIWDALKVDSLANYLHKLGSWSLREALAYEDLFKEGVGGVAYVGITTDLENVAGDTIYMENVDPSVLTNLQGRDRNAILEGGKIDSYKWFYIKRGDKYLTYDVVRPNLESNDGQRYGFRFIADGTNYNAKASASLFRFYQPLVGDKEQEFFLIETFVPTATYKTTTGTVNTTLNYQDAYGAMTGVTVYMQLAQNSRDIYATRNVKDATRWDFDRVAPKTQCAVDYINNEFLGTTRMFGAPLKAQRVDITKTDTTYGDFIVNKGSYAVEAATNAIKFTLVPAGKIVPDAAGKGWLTTLTNPETGVCRTYNGNSTLGFTNFGAKSDRFVQLYYVRTTDGKYMSVTKNNVFSQDLQQMAPSVSGDVLDFETLFSVPDNKKTSFADSTLLQVFAVYGKLGIDDDRKGGSGCITPYDKEYTFGQFMFVPAAAYLYDYNNQKAGAVSVNANIGNPDVSDEFRVGAYHDRKSGDYKLIVLPDKTTGASSDNGIPASEYVFSYELYKKGFECLNFIQKLDNPGYYVSAAEGDANRQNVKDYADASVQWAVNLGEDGAKAPIYTFTNNVEPGKLRNRNQYPLVKNTTTLSGSYYFYLISEAETAYKGYSRKVIAVDPLRVQNKEYYNCGATWMVPENIQIDEITNKYTDDVSKVADANAVIRQYNGDSAIDYYKKLSEEEAINFAWAILETYYQDRYIWSKMFDPAVANEMVAYAEQGGSSVAKFLRIVPAGNDTIAKCSNGKVNHYVPYYSIIYKGADQDYYLTSANGDIKFIGKSKIAAADLAALEAPGLTANLYKANQYKFCFPYALNTGNINSIQRVDVKAASENYNEDRLYIQSMPTFEKNAANNWVIKANTNVYLARIIGTSGKMDYNTVNLATSPANLFTDKDELGATTWFFSGKPDSESKWVKLQYVYKANSKGTKDMGALKFTDKSSGFVYPSGEADPNYGILMSMADLANSSDLNLEFEFVDSANIAKYYTEKIWYYRVKDTKSGKYLTSGHSQASTSKYWYTVSGVASEPYAYFTDKLTTTDSRYTQLFGLRYAKYGENYKFWVVAGVDSTKSNTATATYYYLSSINQRLTFRPVLGGTAGEEQRKSALVFEYGKISNDKYTDIDGVDTAETGIYGVEGGVKVVNGTGLVEVYTIDGRLVKSATLNGAEQTIAAPRGVVIVKNGANVEKVVVK